MWFFWNEQYLNENFIGREKLGSKYCSLQHISSDKLWLVLVCRTRTLTWAWKSTSTSITTTTPSSTTTTTYCCSPGAASECPPVPTSHQALGVPFRPSDHPGWRRHFRKWSCRWTSCKASWSRSSPRVRLRSGPLCSRILPILKFDNKIIIKRCCVNQISFFPNMFFNLFEYYKLLNIELK